MRDKVGAEQPQQVLSLGNRPDGVQVGQDRLGRSNPCRGRRDRHRRLRDRDRWA
jgi:hypothetical protein